MPKLTVNQLRDHLEQELATMNLSLKHSEHRVEELNMRDDRLVIQLDDFKKEFKEFRSEMELRFTELSAQTELRFIELSAETELRFIELSRALDSYFTNLEKQLRELKTTQ